MPDWAVYLLLLFAGFVLGRLTAGRRDDRPRMPAAPPRPPTPELEAEVRRLMSQDQKIQAIKRYREATGASLKDAKDAVEAMDER